MVKRAASKGPYTCYVLQNGARTYVGQTNNFKRRLRQHRGELAGGARYTRRTNEAHGPKGTWAPMFRVKGFQTLRAVLQFELAMKRKLKGTRGGRGTGTVAPAGRQRGPKGRVLQLEHLLARGRITEEPHSPFVANGVRIVCHISVSAYLDHAGLDIDAFLERRAAQGVPFRWYTKMPMGPGVY
jgi:predicted GIY-YIG superfamily endonuclease